MRSYTDDTLSKDEKVLLRATLSLRPYWINFLLGVPMLLMLPVSVAMALSGPDTVGVGFSVGLTYLLIAALFLTPPLLRRCTNELVLTNKRVVSKAGLISLKTTELRLDKVESLNIKQGLWGKLLNYGAIQVTGTGASHAIVKGVSDPVNFRKYFARAAEDAV